MKLTLANNSKDSLVIDSENQIDLLINGNIGEFNRYVEQGILVHLPYGKLSNINANHIVLKNGFLFSIELIYADLSRADLSRADLSHADLSGADLIFMVRII